jgi:hypothetical protein
MPMTAPRGRQHEVQSDLNVLDAGHRRDDGERVVQPVNVPVGPQRHLDCCRARHRG